jgi:hypothetical protein
LTSIISRAGDEMAMPIIPRSKSCRSSRFILAWSNFDLSEALRMPVAKLRGFDKLAP